jgi:hypothetical protein
MTDECPTDTESGPSSKGPEQATQEPEKGSGPASSRDALMKALMQARETVARRSSSAPRSPVKTTAASTAAARPGGSRPPSSRSSTPSAPRAPTPRASRPAPPVSPRESTRPPEPPLSKCETAAELEAEPQTMQEGAAAALASDSIADLHTDARLSPSKSSAPPEAGAAHAPNREPAPDTDDLGAAAIEPPPGSNDFDVPDREPAPESHDQPPSDARPAIGGPEGKLTAAISQAPRAPIRVPPPLVALRAPARTSERASAPLDRPRSLAPRVGPPPPARKTWPTARHSAPAVEGEPEHAAGPEHAPNNGAAKTTDHQSVPSSLERSDIGSPASWAETQRSQSSVTAPAAAGAEPASLPELLSPPRAGRAVRWVGIVVLLLCAGALGLSLVQSKLARETQRPKPDRASVTRPRSPKPAPSATSPSASETAATPETAAAAATASAPETSPGKTQVQLNVKPVGALVFESGKRLGKAPLTVEIEPGQERTLDIMARGYAMRKLTLDASQEQVDVALKRAKAKGPDNDNDKAR